MYGYIYLTTNLINNKKYIGQHRSDEFDSAYSGSGVLFVKALKKYHRSNFKTEILATCETEEELNEQEIAYISKYNAVEDLMFYNISYGGYRRSVRDLVAVYNPETDHGTYCCESLVSYFESLGYRRGTRNRSEVSRKKLSDTRKKMISMTNDQETIYCFPEEVDKYIQKGYRKGRIPTRPNQKSEARKWMNKDGESIMVRGCEVQSFLDNGYKLGRSKFSHFNRVAPAHNKGKVMKIVNNKVTYVVPD